MPERVPRTTAKATATRSAIIDAALRLFAERGYEATTMRAVAAEAGVSLGNAYYYFASKEHLIQGFYDRAGRSHADVLSEVLAEPTTLEARLLAHLVSWYGLMQPYQPFASQFFRNAADPASPLSPFSPESTATRQLAIDGLRLVVDGTTSKIPKAVRAELPELLWLYHMGTILFWVHDRSHDAAATRLLLHRTVPMVVRAVEVSGLPVLRGLIGDVVGLIGDLKLLLNQP